MAEIVTAPIVRSAADGRLHADRRRRPTPMVSRYLFRGRRRAGRRAGEQIGQYADRPPRWVLVACFSVLVLSIGDAYMTLRILTDGGSEANPIMEAVLSLGSLQFVALKTTLTFFGAAVLCLHQNWLLGRVGLMISLSAYGILALYYLVMQSHELLTSHAPYFVV